MLKNGWAYFSLAALLFFGISFTACSNQNSFYQKGSGWDYLRFPLLEPYYAIQVNDEGWDIPLHIEPSKTNCLHCVDIHDIEKFAVNDGAIMVYSSYSKQIDIGGGVFKELHWFILIPEEAELGYETEEEFINNIQQYGISQPQWQEPLTILQTYEKTGCLEWIPDCE